MRRGEPGIEADRPAQGELTVLHPAAACHHHVRILEQAELLLLPRYLKTQQQSVLRIRDFLVWIRTIDKGIRMRTRIRNKIFSDL
jgi:hypothetical protein